MGHDAVRVRTLRAVRDVTPQRLGRCSDRVGEVAVGRPAALWQRLEDCVEPSPVERWGGLLLWLLPAVHRTHVGQSAAVLELPEHPAVGNGSLDVLTGTGWGVEELAVHLESAVDADDRLGGCPLARPGQ